MKQELFDRQKRLIGEDAQRQIHATKVGVVGCGVTGQIVATQCTKMGVCELRLIDNDIVKQHNLPNSLIFNKSSLQAAKEVATAKVAEQYSLNDLKTRTDHFNITSPDNWERLLDFISGLDIIIGALDNIPARLSLNAAALITGTKYLDIGIEGFAGRVRFIDRNRGCYACDTLVPEDKIENIYNLDTEEDGCDYAPTVTILPTALATTAHAMVETIKYLEIFGEPPVYDYIYFNFLTPGKPVRMNIEKRKDCIICGKEGMIKW